jgi:hypothetical protein
MTIRQLGGKASGFIASDYRGRRRAHKRLRVGLLLLALSAAYPGIWALIAPKSFFTDFPGLGFEWVNLLGTYNEHLVRDVGGFYLGFALLLVAATITLSHVLTISALIAWLGFSIPHLIFHLAHLDGLETGDAVGQTVTLGITVLLPLYLLTQLRKSEH